MANTFYTPFKQSQGSAAPLDFASGGDAFSFALVDLGTYTPNFTTHDFMNDVSGITAEGAVLASQTYTAGVFDAADDPDMFVAVSGSESEALILKLDTGTAATERLVCLFDTGVTGLPVTPNGGDIGVVFNGSGIFAL